MTTIRISRIMPAFVAVLILLGSGTSAAQEGRSLRIAEGEVYVDGRLVPKAELPAGLDIGGTSGTYTFSGNVLPLIQLGDQFYVLDGDRLRVADPQERRNAFFSAAPPAPDATSPEVHVQFRTFQDGDPRSPHIVEFSRRAEQLKEQARQLEQVERTIQRQLGDQQIRQLEQLARSASVHAAEAARVAIDLPRVELETYLEEIRRQNEGLFDRLVNERQLEHGTMERAQQIRTMGEGDERSQLVRELRVQLDQIFELKQANRRNEVERLETRLEELEEKLVERERLRKEIVERRLRELVGEDGLNW